MTDTAIDTVVPLSRYRGTLRDFASELRYPRSPGAEQRFYHDAQLLDALQKRRRNGEIVRDVPAATVLAVVADLEERFYPHWQLAGDDSEDVFARVDLHYRPLQELFVAEQAEAASHIQRRMAESAEQTAAAEQRAVDQNAILWSPLVVQSPEQPNAQRRFTGDLGPWPEGTSDETLQADDEDPMVVGGDGTKVR